MPSRGGAETGRCETAARNARRGSDTTRTFTQVVPGISLQVTETATALITWKVSGGFQHRNHHDRGLAHLAICHLALAGPEEQWCGTFPNELSINRCQFGAEASHASGSG